MSSGIETAAVVAFAPTAAGLDAALGALDAAELRSGGAVDAATRRAALARYEALPAPGLRPGRGWRHDYAKLAFDQLAFTTGRRAVATVPVVAAAPDGADADVPALATANAGGLVHVGPILCHPEPVDGGSQARPGGVTVAPLAGAPRDAHLSLAPWRDDKFAALAVAFQNCGAYVHVPDGVVLDAPIQLVFAADPAEPQAVFPHVVVVLGEGARATIVERHVGEGPGLVCGLVEVVAGARASVDYVVVQQASEEARIFFHRAASAGPDAAVRWHLAELGGTLARTVLDARLDAAGARAEASALFFATGMQHIDLLTSTEHAVGNTLSETVVRSAATDRGQGRYIGNIVIEKRAHGSDASLRDDALLLSRHAHIDSVPALEIAANDVKAYHGATIGSLDEDALFYAQSRGIPRGEATRMVALAFFEPAIVRFPGDVLRDEIRTALDAKIGDATELGS